MCIGNPYPSQFPPKYATEQSIRRTQGILGSLIKNNLSGVFHGNNFINYSDSGRDRCVSILAAQPRLGLRSEWGGWSDRDCSDHHVDHRTIVDSAADAATPRRVCAACSRWYSTAFFASVRPGANPSAFAAALRWKIRGSEERCSARIAAY